MKQIIFIIGILLALTAAGCGGVGPGGSVVKVRSVGDDTYAGLEQEQIEQISEFRKAAGQAEIASVAITGETKNYTVEEYMARFPVLAKPGGVVYKVGGNDVLNIQVFDEENLTREGVRVSGDGFITFPLIGRLYVDGLATSEIEDLIASKLAQGQFILDAQVTVLMAQFASKKYKVLGAVEKPGIYPLKMEENLLDAVSNAQGVDQEASGKRLMLIRSESPGELGGTGDKLVINIDLDKLLKGADQISNLPLLDKDVVYVPKAEFFYIMGQVKEPGSYKFTDVDMTIVEAISTAGGFTPIAARNRTRIVRVDNGDEKIITVNVDAITDAGKKIQDVPIRPGDIIIVPESFF